MRTKTFSVVVKETYTHHYFIDGTTAKSVRRFVEITEPDELVDYGVDDTVGRRDIVSVRAVPQKAKR
jgi:hypothetical protein